MHMKITFNLILTLALWLVAAQGAWAATETRTVTFYMDGGASGNTSVQNYWTLVSSGKTIHWSNNDPSNNKITCKSDKKLQLFVPM